MKGTILTFAILGLLLIQIGPNVVLSINEELMPQNGVNEYLETTNNQDTEQRTRMNTRVKRDLDNWMISEVVSTESWAPSVRPSFCIDDEGTIHMVWQDQTDFSDPVGDSDIFYKMKPRGGSWTTTEEISIESDGHSARPSLVVDNEGTLHLVWDDYIFGYGDQQIFYKMKPKGGDWTTIEIVSNEGISSADAAYITIDHEDTLHVVWEGFGNISGNGDDLDIFYKMKPKDGSWTTTEVVSTESICHSFIPSLGIDDAGAIHVIWQDWENDYGNSGNDDDIFYKMKPAGGNWAITEVVSTESGNYSNFPSLDVESDGTVHVAWYDYTNYEGSGYDTDIFYKTKSNQSIWTTTEVISTESAGSSWMPFLTVDVDGTVHVAWEDETDYNDSGFDVDILYKTKPKGGNWTAPEIISTESNLSSNEHYITVDNNKKVHVAWQDRTNYCDSGIDVDIFYKMKNNLPEIPDVPSGPISGKVGISYNFSTTSIDVDGDEIYYNILWRDSCSSECSGLVENE